MLPACWLTSDLLSCCCLCSSSFIPPGYGLKAQEQQQRQFEHAKEQLWSNSFRWKAWTFFSNKLGKRKSSSGLLRFCKIECSIYKILMKEKQNEISHGSFASVPHSIKVMTITHAVIRIEKAKTGLSAHAWQTSTWEAEWSKRIATSSRSASLGYE